MDSGGGIWKVKRLTVAENPVGFYLVHLCYGPTLEQLDESMIFGTARIRCPGSRPRPEVAPALGLSLQSAPPGFLDG